jgi:lysophospholipase L1-like esterase
VKRSIVLLLLAGSLVAGCAKPPAAPDTPMPAVGPGPVPPPPPVAKYTMYMTFGDSLTEGLDTPELFAYNPGVTKGYPYKLQALLQTRYTTQTMAVDNEGCGGHRAADDYDRLVSQLDDKAPQVTILLEGVNDLNMGGAPDDAIDAVHDLADAIREHGSELILSTLPPERPGAPRAFAPDAIVPFNQALADLAPRVGAVLVDIYPLITTPVADGLLAPDGLHLTETGNAKVAQAYFDAIRTNWEQPATPQTDRLGRGVSVASRHVTSTPIPCTSGG